MAAPPAVQPLLPLCSGPPPSTTASASLTLENHGTAAVHYSWVLPPAVLPPFSTLAASASEGKPTPTGLSLSRSSGTILPGAVEEFKVVFRPQKGFAGMATQQWVLSTSPLLVRHHKVALIPPPEDPKTKKPAAKKGDSRPTTAEAPQLPTRWNALHKASSQS